MARRKSASKSDHRSIGKVSKRASVDNTRHTGGTLGVKARQAGKRIGQK